MKNRTLIALIVAPLILALLIIAGAYWYLSDRLFLPWNQELITDDTDAQISIDETDSTDSQISGETAEGSRQTIIANYIDGMQKPRLMAQDPFGNIIVSDIGADAVYAVIDDNVDFKADRKVEIISGLNNPHGLAFWGRDLYIAETTQVRVLKNLTEEYTYDENQIIIDDLTNNQGHFTRTLEVIDEKLYLSVGSSCNVCYESNPNRAKILRYELDGSNRTEFATGLRNTVGFVQSPFDGKIYGTDNGRDWLGDHLPPEEINIIEANNDYGWPICYGDRVHDTEFDKNRYIRDPCEDTTPPVWTLDAHQAPLGLRFYNGEMFPELAGDLLVALHGSWNSSVPVGYRVARIHFDDDGQPASESTFLNNFITTQGKILGRPVDILVGERGEIYVSDDFAGRIYVVYR